MNLAKKESGFPSYQPIDAIDDCTQDVWMSVGWIIGPIAVVVYL
jgi:hypothetical protein